MLSKLVTHLVPVMPACGPCLVLSALLSWEPHRGPAPCLPGNPVQTSLVLVTPEEAAAPTPGQRQNGTCNDYGRDSAPWLKKVCRDSAHLEGAVMCTFSEPEGSGLDRDPKCRLWSQRWE